MLARERVVGAELSEDRDHHAPDQVAARRVGLRGEGGLERLERGRVVAAIPSGEGGREIGAGGAVATGDRAGGCLRPALELDPSKQAGGLLARVELTRNGDLPGPLAHAFGAWDGGDHAAALEALQASFAAETDPERRDLIRRVMVGIFTELGPDDPLAREHRRRLSSAVN